MATFADVLNTFGVKSFSPLDAGVQKIAEFRSAGKTATEHGITITPESQALQFLGLEKDPLHGLVNSDDTSFLSSTLPKILAASFGAVAGFGIGGAIGAGIGGATKFVSEAASAPQQGGRMSFADGDSSGFQLPSFGDIGQVFQGELGRNLLNIGTQALSGFVANQFSPGQGIQTNMAAVGTMGRAVATVGRGFFNRFPNLATAIQGLRNRGANVTRSQLWGMMKRFGPELMISGGILTAAAVSELMIAGPGRRRMNPGNVKALRRAHRRMKSFHNVCMTNDRLLGGRRSSKRKGSFGGATSVVNVK